MGGLLGVVDVVEQHHFYQIWGPPQVSTKNGTSSMSQFTALA